MLLSGMLAFLIAEMNNEWHRQVASYLRRSLILKLYLEKGIITHTYNEIFHNLQKFSIM